MNSVLRNPDEREIMKAVRAKAFHCGDPVPGAFSRIEEYFRGRGEKISRTTVRKVLTGEDGWKFSEGRIKLLGDMITEGIVLCRKFSTGRPKNLVK